MTSPDGFIVAPLRATFPRWRVQSRSEYSLLRGLQYERLRSIELTGRSLDVGGGRRADYLPLVNARGRLDSLNIDPSLVPTTVGDLNAGLPFRSRAFDNVVSLNTLEHVLNDVDAVAEILRVLDTGGRFHIFVPFLYRVHGSPSDYHRRTAYWWLALLSQFGARRVEVEPLVWDPLASGFSIIEFNRLRGLLKRPLMLRAVIAHRRWRGSARLPKDMTDRVAAYAIGYYITGLAS